MFCALSPQRLKVRFLSDPSVYQDQSGQGEGSKLLACYGLFATELSLLSVAAPISTHGAR